MSVIPLKADIHQRGLHVRLVPTADISPYIALVGARYYLAANHWDLAV
jgi:hypothetical protein